MYIFEVFHNKNKKPPVTKESGYLREQISTVQRDDGHIRGLVLVFLGKAIFKKKKQNLKKLKKKSDSFEVTQHGGERICPGVRKSWT